MTGAAVDSIVVGLTVIGVNVAMIERRRRWPDGPPPRWPDEKRPYDLWLLYNLWRPFEVLSVVACARAVAHFGDSATEPYVRGVFAVAAVGLAGYLFVIGPMFRPHSALSSVRPFDPVNRLAFEATRGSSAKARNWSTNTTESTPCRATTDLVSLVSPDYYR
jgi:hypothetical protein